MRIFYRRPLASLCALFIIASLLGFFAGAPVKYAMSVLLIAGALVLVLLFVNGKISRKKLTMCVAAAISVLIALLVSYIYFDVGYMSAQKYCGGSHKIEGVVLERRYVNSYSTGYGIRISKIDGERVYYIAILDSGYVSDLQPGYSFTAEVEPEKLGYSDYDASDRLYALADGYVLRCVLTPEGSCEITGEDDFSLTVWLTGINRRLTSLLTSSVGGEEGKLAAALSLGRQDLPSDATIRNFRRSGAAHMLALSGVNLTFLMVALDYILKKLCVGRSVRCVLLIAFTFFFLAITGFSVSATRAAVMLAFVYLSYLFSAQSDPLTSLFTAGALIILVSPPSVSDAGFWLSFSAALGIIIGASASGELINYISRKKPGAVRGALSKGKVLIVTAVLTTVSANCAVAFTSWIYFGEMSALTVLTNIILTPPSSLLLAAVMLFTALSGIPAAAGILSGLIRFISGIMIDITSYFSGKENAVVSLRYAFAGVIIIAMTSAYIILCVINLRKKRYMVLPGAAAFLAFVICLGIFNGVNAENVRVTYLNNDGNEMLLVSNLGSAVICDISDGSKSNIRMALSAAEAENVTEIKAFILTHYHQRHIASTDRLLGGEMVRQLWLPEPCDEREYGVMLSLIDCAEKHGCAAVIYKRGGELSIFGGGRLTVDTAYIKRSTHPVIAVSLECGGERFTYAGASVQESGIYNTAARYIGMSSNIIFGAHGPVTKVGYSYEGLYGGLAGVVFADDVVLSAFRFEGDLTALEGAVLTRGPQFKEFTYKKQG